MNEFSYGQALLFYKDVVEELEKRENIKIIFEQDGTSSHTSKTNKFLLNKLFKEDGCQNLIIIQILHILSKIFGQY